MSLIKILWKRKDDPSNKYEFKRSDYDDTYKLTRKLLKFCAIKMTHKLSPFTAKCWNIYFWIQYANLVVALFVSSKGTFDLANSSSFEGKLTVVQMMPCFGMIFLSLLKPLKMVKHRSVYENLVNELGDMWPEGRLEDEEYAIVCDAMKQLHIVLKGYYWCNNGLIVTFFVPAIVDAVKRAFGYKNEMLLPFCYWLPFNLVHEILLLVQIWHGLSAIFFNITADLLYFTYVEHISMQFDLMSVRIRRLFFVPIDNQLIDAYPLSVYSKQFNINEESNPNNDAEWERRHQKDIKEIIERHKTLIRLSDDVERMFSFTMFVNFFNSAVMICFCGFCCVVIEKWNEPTYKFFLMSALSQTYLICWYGQKLLDSSLGVSLALYNSGWYKASEKIKNTLLFMLLRTQKEVRLTTYGFTVISLKSYTKIIKTAWSYFTLLLNVYDHK